MQYNRLNGIVQKALQYTLNGQDKGYTLNYEYNNKKHPHAPSSIAGLPSFGGAGGGKPRNYQYDGNGNPVSYNEFKSFRSMVWDEENRLRGINDNGRLHLYTYDHTGERALKSSAESSMAVINGATSAIITHTEDYTAYVSPYFVVNKGKFTKHYFEGSSRVVSKLGEGTFVHKNTGIMAGGIDYIAQSAQVQTAIDQYIRGLQVPPGPPTQHGIYATPEWTGEAYPSIDWSEVSQNQEPPEGWPRPPKFNDPGDVPGPPVQFGEAITNANVRAGYGYIPNGVEEKNLYFYHPDHLGSSSYITNKDGEIIQHTEYMAFGETFVDEHSVSNKMPYLFNGKELDYETGLYYYGARYYDPKVSIFLNVDPLVEKTGTPYAYTYNNPIRFIDPTGMEPTSTDVRQNKDGSYTVVGAYNDGDTNIYVVNSKGKRTGEVIGRTMRDTDFMLTNDSNGTFSGHSGTTFRLDGLTISGSVKPNEHTIASIYGADAQQLLDWGQQLFQDEVKRQSPITFYGKLEILRDMSANGAALDFKVSLGKDKYTAIKAGTTSDGKPIITTLRAMGNMTFGANMRSTKPSILGSNWYYNKVMGKVGEYNQNQNGGNGYNKGHPYFGEHTYSGSYIYYGYFGSFYKK